MYLCSYNVNGLQASIKKGLLQYLVLKNFDIICFQETKCVTPILKLDGYFNYWNFCEKKGYSGTAIFTKKKPISIQYGLTTFKDDGRVITLEYETFFLVNIYAPTAKEVISRIDYRMKWDEELLQFICTLERKKPVIICGDFNVSVSLLKDVSSFTFMDDRCCIFHQLLDYFIDVFSYKNPNMENCFTWWKIGKKDIGFRLDYFLVSNYLKSSIVDSLIDKEVNYSDHAPITLQLEKIEW